MCISLTVFETILTQECSQGKKGDKSKGYSPFSFDDIYMIPNLFWIASNIFCAVR